MKRQGKRKGNDSDLAVIGMSCRFPDADNYEQFWLNLLAGVDSITEVSKDRWDIEEYYSPNIDAPNRTYSKWGGFVRGISYFDNRFFGISPREAAEMDPQQRLLLEEVWHCIEDSGITPAHLSNHVTACYVGVMATDYQRSLLEAGTEVSSYSCSGNYSGMLANRVSHQFGLSGESKTIDTACSSSLVALHDAKRALLRGECDYAVVAGVSAIINPWRYISFGKARMLSPEGKCKTFDLSADGYVPGEGVGVVLLQRAETALHDQRRIHGFIKGSAVNHCGGAASITAPSVDAQASLLRNALADAGVSPSEIGYIEAHGTGTSLGDPIEVEAISRAFDQRAGTQSYCKIGSVKSNIGHLEAAAGIAGLIKVLLMMKHRKIVKTLHLNTPNPVIDFERSPVTPAYETSDWEPHHPAANCYAGVSSFGFGGVNSHVVVEEAVQATNSSISSELDVSLPVLISAKTKASARILVERWIRWSKTQAFEGANLADLCVASVTTRPALPYRFAVNVTKKSELQNWLLNIMRDLSGDESLLKNEKTRSVRWRLELGGGEVIGFSQFNEICKQNNLIYQHYKTCLDIIKRQSKINEAGHVGNARVKDLKVFAMLYSIAGALLDAGFIPGEITGAGTGYFVALVLAGVVGLEQIIGFLSGGTDSSELRFNRPRIDFYDTYSDHVVSSVGVEDAYLQGLFENLIIDSMFYEELLEKARLLIDAQFTFKKFIKEWKVSDRKVEVDVEGMLRDKATPLPSLDSAQGKFLFLAVASSMRRLSKKWDLSDKALAGTQELNEVVELLTQRIITPSETAGFLISPVLNPGMLREAMEIRIRSKETDLDSLPLLSRFTPLTDPVLDTLRSGHMFEDLDEDNAPTFHITPIDSRGENNEHISCSLSNGLVNNYQELLVTLWKAGVDIDFSKTMQQIDSGRPVELPAYPFTGGCHWKGSREDTMRKESGSFSLTFDIREPVVRDHVILGQRILPGASMIDIALAFANQDGTSVNELSGIVIHRPVTVNTRLEFVCYRAEPDRIEIRTEGELFFSCKTQVQGSKPQSQERCDPSVIGTPLNIAELYAGLRMIGYDYGPSLQVIHSARRTADGVLFDIRQTAPSSQRSQLINPALLDGVFQSVLFALQESDNPIPSAGLLVPALAGQLTVFNTLTERVLVFISDTQIKHSSPDVSINVNVYNEGGELLLAVERLTLRHVRDDFLKPYLTKPEPVNVVNNQAASIFTTTWREYSGHNISDKRPSTVAVMSDGSNGTQYLIDAIVAQGRQALSIDILQNKASWMEVATRIIEISKAVAASKESSFTVVWPMWASSHAAAADIKQVTGQLEQTLENMFLLSQMLATMQLASSCLFVPITQNAYVVASTDRGEGYTLGTLHPFGITVTMENRKLKYAIVDIAGSEVRDADWARKIAEVVVSAKPGEIQVRRFEKNYVRRFCKIEWRSDNTKISSYRNNSTYVILGGAGGIGLKLAEWILTKNASNVILVGRSKLNERQRQVLSSLSNERGSIEYLQGDATSEHELTTCLGQIRQKYGRINGIVNAVGVLEDGLLLTSSLDGFRRVIHTKLRSTWLLDNLTKNDPLEFFVVFSSIVSLVGNVGQTNYAAANGYLDEFANFRRKSSRPGQSVAVNWTLWADGGMGLSDVVVQRLSARGLPPIVSTNAFQALDAILNSGQSGQFAVTNGTPPELEVKLVKQTSCSKFAPGAVDAVQNGKNYVFSAKEKEMASDNKDDARAHEYCLAISSVISDVLSVPQNEIDYDTDLREYGIDSVALTVIGEKLSEKYGDLFYPSLLVEHPNVNSLVAYWLGEVLATNAEVNNLNLVVKGGLRSNILECQEEDTVIPSGVLADNVQSQVTQLLADVLHIPPSEIDDDMAISDLDPVVQSNFMEALTRKFGAKASRISAIDISSIAHQLQIPRQVPTTRIERSEEHGGDSHLEPKSRSARGAQSRAIEDKIVAVINDVLQIPHEEIERDVDLREYGVDSVAVTVINDRLFDIFGDAIYPGVVFELRTIEKLAQYVDDNTVQTIQSELRNDSEVSSDGGGGRQSSIHVESVTIKPDSVNEREIAIIGMAGRFPGSPTLEHYLDNLKNGRDLVKTISDDRWPVNEYFRPWPSEVGKTYSRWAGLIEGVDMFDAGYFGIKEKDALEMDPQQRIFLEITQELLDRAGYSRNELKGSSTGVFVGATESNYGRHAPERSKFQGKNGVVNVVSNLIPGRVSDFYDFHGPSLTFYTACSSSLVAIHNACLALRAGDCNLAIAGGIELLLDEEWYIGFSNSQALSPDGRCKVFDSSANGFVLGEGVGVVMLKPLRNALIDGDQILGVIESTGLNNDGSTMGLTSPNGESQKSLIRHVLAQNDIDPSTISYYEAHGTGTPLGDPIEIKGATEVYREYTNDTGYCALGSVKSNIGHLLSAAGIASLVKILLGFESKLLFPTLHCDAPHPRFKFDESPFRLSRSTDLWQERSGVRRAALSSFGFGGTNAHMILRGFDNGVFKYNQRRQPRPVTTFDRKRYWIPRYNEADNALTIHEDSLLQIMEALSRGDLSEVQAKQQIEALGLSA